MISLFQIHWVDHIILLRRLSDLVRFVAVIVEFEGAGTGAFNLAAVDKG